MMSHTKPTTTTILQSMDDVPIFATEAEEAEFWDTHDLSDELTMRMQPIPEEVLPPARPRTTSIAVRFDDDTLRRVKRLASIKNKGYQTLLKEFVAERLYEEEKREGLISSRARG